MNPLGADTLYVEMAPIRPSSCKVQGELDNNKVRGEVVDGTELQSGVIKAAFNHSVLSMWLLVLLIAQIKGYFSLQLKDPHHRRVNRFSCKSTMILILLQSPAFLTLNVNACILHLNNISIWLQIIIITIFSALSEACSSTKHFSLPL